MRERWEDPLRTALAEVEEQRDDAVTYLAAIKLVLDVVARGHGARQCGQEIAEALVRQLALETCAVAFREPEGDDLVLGGFATQAQRLGGPRGGLGEAGWLALARLVRAGIDPTCFRRLGDGSFAAVAPGELSGEGFFVLPFRVGGEAGGALVLHSLVAPAQVFTRGRSLTLLAEIVGQALTIAFVRDGMQRLCAELEGELGVARRTLSDQQASLRSHEENIEGLTQALIDSNRVKRDFLGTVSHELRTPLNAILGYASLMREGAVGPVSSEQSSVLDRVLSNTQNLNALIDDILFFVQLEADRVLPQRVRVETEALIAEVAAAIPPPAEGARVPLRVTIAPEAVALHVDGSLLRRLLFHLLGNAFKFTKAGEVTVTVEPVEERRAVVVSVRDTGVGIPSERITGIFELFAQGDGSPTRRYAGLGMGLTLVQRCARLLGGTVAVESQRGTGSTFRVRLPGALPDPAAERRRPTLDTVH